MGAKESRPGFITHEDALKRVSEGEVRRLREAHRRAANGAPALAAAAFYSEVLAESAPPRLAERLFLACGGSRRGLPFKDLLCGLVLLTKGTQDERIKFLWSLYCNEAGTYIAKSDFIDSIQNERSSLSPWKSCQVNTNMHMVATTLFGGQGDKVNFETFRSWLLMHKNATIFSNWLLLEQNVNLSCDLETPTFYQSLAGVTHLEERDICLLEKYFWRLISGSASGQLDAACMGPLLSPPVPKAVLNGLLLALDENRDGHVDFKELCCGLSAACRGPVLERVKFCFKIFDADRDGVLNQAELRHMINVLCFVANESLQNKTKSNKPAYEPNNVFDSLKDMMTTIVGSGATPKHSKESLKESKPQLKSSTVSSGYSSDSTAENGNSLSSEASEMSHENEEFGLSQDNFLIWHVDKGNNLVAPFLQLIFQVCHIVLGLRPQCKHQEQEIVFGWLSREVRRGYSVGQFWYLISADWWNIWKTYTNSGNANGAEKGDLCCACRHTTHRTIQPPIDEAIVCDENFNNSSDWSGDTYGRSETGSLGSTSSSSGVSSNSSSHSARPGPIDNKSLLAPNPYNVLTLTGEGGHLKRDLTLSEHRDFELVPDSLWKALAQWYGGPQPLPRQVIQPPNSGVELELYPRNLRLMKHMPSNQHHGPSTSSWSGMVGGYGAAALSTVGAASYQPVNVLPHRYLAYTAAFSRLATIRQVSEFICSQLKLSREDVRLWLVEESTINQDEGGILTLLENESVTLAHLGAIDGQRLLIEVRNKDLTWPEEMGALSKSALTPGNKRNTLINATPGTPHPPGATGLQNLGNTCFMNAALQAVWNTGPLTCYFTRDMHLYELNTNNPLGTKGALAQRYGELCKEVWNSGARSVAPLRVRLCICQNADQFSGGGQHDSQELLAWLLDALHEDLNRVAIRPYTELRDSDGRPDQVVAQEAWEQHTARNQSVITELFYGQLKSKVTCTKCKHESVRFDPFNMLSLPLPMESYILVEVLVIKLDGSVPIKYGIRLNSEGRYLDLRDALSCLCGIESNHLLLAEVSGPRINRLPCLRNRLRTGVAIINLYAYQLPYTSCNFQNPIAYMHREPENIDADNFGARTVPPAAAERLSSSSECSDSPSSDNCLPSKDNFTGYNCVDKQDAFSDNNNHKNNVKKICDNTSDESIVYSSQKQLKGIDDDTKFDVTPPSPTANCKIGDSNKSDDPTRPCYLVAIHRKLSRQDMYFLSQHKNKSELFGIPLLIPISEGCTSKQLYTSVWTQVSRLLSVPPPTPPDQSNHATDCDDSLGYTFPFTLRLVSRGGIKCAVCPWTRFCRGCIIPCEDEPFLRNLMHNAASTSDVSGSPIRSEYSSIKMSPCPSPKLQSRHRLNTTLDESSVTYDSQIHYIDFKELEANMKYTTQPESSTIDKISIAIDWDPTALHLRYQSTRERVWIDHSSVVESRAAHAAAVQLHHCFHAFTSEEQLEQRYSCAKCRTSQPATKKLQIWRLPPILVIHLKRFQYVNNKWIKSQKVVDFPYKNFDPTAFLASVPQETILRHAELKQHRSRKLVSMSECTQVMESEEEGDVSDDSVLDDEEPVQSGTESLNEPCNIERLQSSNISKTVRSDCTKESEGEKRSAERRKSSVFVSNRERLESTSLTKTPVVDDDFVDYHQHKLKTGEDPFDLKYRLYAVVSHSGMMNGGHYVSYARNPSGAWYCYNDSSCKELTPPAQDTPFRDVTPSIDPSSAYMLFYERTGLDYEPYLPDVSGKRHVLSETELADGEDSDFKKMCIIS